MPPEDEPQPEAAAKTEFLATLSQALATARKTIGDQGRIATLRRLNRREYKNTLRAWLDVDVDASSLPDYKGGGPFDTIGSSLFMSSDQFEQYLALGRKAAGGDPAKAKDFGLPDDVEAKFRIRQYEIHGPYLGQFLAAPKSDDGAWLMWACGILAHFATQAFRGVQPKADYLDGLVGVYEGQRAAGKSFADAIVEPLAVILASPAFLYLNEPLSPPKVEPTDTLADGDRNLSDLELAARLSYFLWAAPPDAELIAAAANGSLRTPAALAQQTQRLMADRRAEGAR